MSLQSFSQVSKTRVVKETTLVKIKKKVEKCDSLRVAFDTMSLDTQQLQNSILNKVEKIESLKKEKKIVEDKVNEHKKMLNKIRKKKIHFGVQLGTSINYENDKFKPKPYLGIGITYSLFSI